MPLLEGFQQSYTRRQQSAHNRSYSTATSVNGNSERFVRLSNDFTKLEFRLNDSANYRIDSAVRVEHILGLKITNQTQNLLRKLQIDMSGIISSSSTTNHCTSTQSHIRRRSCQPQMNAKAKAHMNNSVVHQKENANISIAFRDSSLHSTNNNTDQKLRSLQATVLSHQSKLQTPLSVLEPRQLSMMFSNQNIMSNTSSHMINQSIFGNGAQF